MRRSVYAEAGADAGADAGAGANAGCVMTLHGASHLAEHYLTSCRDIC